MDLVSAAGWGAVGGLIAELCIGFQRVLTWQRKRHAARAAGRRLPPFKRYFDPVADPLAAALRGLIGAGAGLLVHGQVNGVLPIVATGYAGMEFLQRLPLLFGHGLTESEEPERPAAGADGREPQKAVERRTP
ncbi:hypothetical protein [Kitasatospora sp. NPDC085464]|uniref:hypothetical protein n=1 Tax=Kitasatospora sp. NPDC085464 TaxID=3364063 RepID=UPI0037CCA109